jgi:probable F420-dependent oxidoreductase
MRFGVSFPTCKEGLSLPLPYCDVHTTIAMIETAERLGFDSAWGNDHITPPAYVRRDYADPPNFYEPLMVFAAAAKLTSRIKLGVAVLVLPMREPVFLAKQLATLDQITNGRIILAVGTGAYREEFERIFPRLKGAHRGRMLEEGVEALQRLFSQRHASFKGDYYEFDGIDLGPRPVQDPFPIYMGGNNENVMKRAAKVGQGWMPAAISGEEIRRGRDELFRLAEQAGRDPTTIDIAPQLMVCLPRGKETAVERFKQSRMYVHLHSLASSTLREQNLSRMEQVNLIGSPAELVDRIDTLERAGVTTLAAISFLSETPEIMVEDMQLFAEEVMPHFRRNPQ